MKWTVDGNTQLATGRKVRYKIAKPKREDTYSVYLSVGQIHGNWRVIYAMQTTDADAKARVVEYEAYLDKQARRDRI